MTLNIHHFDGCEIAKETWNQIDTLFGAQAKSSKFGLLIEIFKLDMASKMPLASHSNNMQSLMSQLACICLKVDEDIAIAILKSLPSSYNHIVTTLTNMPIFKLVDVQASLLEEGKKSIVVCDFCHKHGHEEKNWFAKKKMKEAYFSFKLEEEDDEDGYYQIGKEDKGLTPSYLF
ncbi:hypothetical protein L7F22_041491 [Adiantum nelumboides]|nr:hypothetical protein [Adiantum nelumboides]